MANSHNNLNEIWLYTAKDCGILDGGGFAMARKPAGAELDPSYKITAWTSKAAVLAYVKKKKLPILSESDDLVEVQGVSATLRFTRVAV